MDAIKINSLTKKYKDVIAADNLSLSVRNGELFSLLGRNGAGKTTSNFYSYPRREARR